MMQGLLREMFGLVRMVLKDKDADLLLATERARAAVTVNVECDGMSYVQYVQSIAVNRTRCNQYSTVVRTLRNHVRCVTCKIRL